MRIQGPDGATAKFIAWNLCSDQSFVLVALDDGSLQEWRLNSCRIVEDRKTSDVVGLAATDNQHTQHAIAALRSALSCHPVNLDLTDAIVASFEKELQQHAGA